MAHFVRCFDVFWPSHGWMAHFVCCFDNLDHLGPSLAWTWLSEPGSSQVLEWELKLGPIFRTKWDRIENLNRIGITPHYGIELIGIGPWVEFQTHLRIRSRLRFFS